MNKKISLMSLIAILAVSIFTISLVSAGNTASQTFHPKPMNTKDVTQTVNPAEWGSDYTNRAGDEDELEEFDRNVFFGPGVAPGDNHDWNHADFYHNIQYDQGSGHIMRGANIGKFDSIRSASSLVRTVSKLIGFRI